MIRHNMTNFSRQFFHPTPTEYETELCCVECKKETKTKVFNHKITSSDGNVILMTTHDECEHKQIKELT